MTDNTTIPVTGQNARHISQVLRLKPGNTICIIDGTGNEFKGEISEISDRTVYVTIIEQLHAIAEPPVRITVAQAFLKDKKMDTLVRMLTELGIYRWIPFQATRSVANPDKKRLEKRHTRWETIATESLKQCMRSTPPVISTMLTYNEMLAISDECPLKIVLWEDELISLKEIKKSIKSPPSEIFILLGPEGGFTDFEIDSAQKKGFITASLGPRILKAETATIAAATLIQFLFGDMGKNSS